jgi:hypothetical protein
MRGLITNDLLHKRIQKGDELICIKSNYDSPGVYAIDLNGNYIITDNIALISINIVIAKVIKVVIKQ